MPKHDIVRVREGDFEFNVGAAYAKAHRLTVLEDESPYDRAGDLRPATRRGGRPLKPKTSVSAEAAKKKAAKSANHTDSDTSSKE